MPIYEDRNYANALLNDNQHFQDVEARARAQENRDKQISNDKAMLSVVEVSGLSNSEFLNEFKQKRFTSIGNEPAPFEADRLKRFVALLGLCMDRFLIVKLPVPAKWQNRFLPNYYTLSDVEPWKSAYSELSRVNDEYSRYIETWFDLERGFKNYQRNVYSGKKEEIYFNPDFKLRLDLGQEFAKLFLDKFKELLSLKKSATTTEVLKRNLDLTDLLYDASRYTWQLKSILQVELKDELEKVKGTDSLSKLCADSVTGVLSTVADFDSEAFENQIVEILWQELLDLQKSPEQKEQVELIKRAISSEVYEGIRETEVE
jgi:hypothetical protein